MARTGNGFREEVTALIALGEEALDVMARRDDGATQARTVQDLADAVGRFRNAVRGSADDLST